MELNWDDNGSKNRIITLTLTTSLNA